MMEVLRKISVLLILVSTLNFSTSHMMMEPRTSLHIPEKILGVIDIVNNHKNKPGQQYQPAQNQQYQPQYPQYYQPGNHQGQYQGQYQGQGQQSQVQGQNQGQFYPGPTQGTYPQNNAPVYPQPQPTYPQYPVQNGQTQAQGQYQYQNGYQGQNQQGQYQGQNQQGHYQGQNQQGQYQGQAQTGFQNGNQYPNQAGQFQGQTQGQYTGQEVSTGQFQAVQSTGSQTTGFQVTGGHTGNQGPACVCQAWTKPNATKGETGPLEKTENTEVNEVPVRM